MRNILNVGVFSIGLIVVAFSGCGPSKEEIRAEQEKERKEMMAKYYAEERIQWARANQLLLKLSDKELDKLLSNCRNEIRKFAADAFVKHSLITPELITTESLAVYQAEAFVAKRSVTSDSIRIKVFRDIPKKDLESGLRTLDTSYPVLVKEDSFSGPQSRIINYRCKLLDGLEIEVG